MEYIQEVFDRSTGTLTKISMGDWITISELGQLKELGARQIRAVLRQMNFLIIGGTGKNTRHRVANWVMERGWAKRIERKGCYPFDVIGPAARTWIDDHWDAAKLSVFDQSPSVTEAAASLQQFTSRRMSKTMSVQECVCWLCDFYPELTQGEKAQILSVSQPLINRFEGVREHHINRMKLLKSSLVIS